MLNIRIATAWRPLIVEYKEMGGSLPSEVRAFVRERLTAAGLLEPARYVKPGSVAVIRPPARR